MSCSTTRTADGSERTRVRLSDRLVHGKKRIAVVLVGHGSKAKDFDGAMKKVARALRKGPFASVCCAYLEINSPSIPEAVESAVRDGSREVRVLPYFLLSGRHIREDIPRIVSEERGRWKNKAKIVLCPYLGFDPRIVEVVRERVKHGR